ncbi:MAG: penicillin acylase family protein [Polyangiales bacterium]
MNRAAVLLLFFCLSCGDDDVEPDPSAFPGLSAEIQVRTDTHGVHHIQAANASDASFASGYVQARDRLFQMDQIRRRALGRRSELLPQNIDDDILIRTLGMPQMGAASAERAREEYPEAYRLFVAWTAGVNRRIDEVLEGSAPLPTGFGEADLSYQPERWAVEDSFAIGKLILFGNANQLEVDILGTLVERFAPALIESLSLFGPFSDAYILPPEERPEGAPGARPRAIRFPQEWPAEAGDPLEAIRAFRQRLADFRPGASNNWALAGRHTDNGRPLIAGDPHQGISSPAVFHMQHLRTDDGELDVIGFGFVGTPAIQLGHNRHISWTATTSYPDWMDIVDVTYDGTSVAYGGETIAVESRTELIEVAGEATREVEVIEVPGVGVLLPGGLSPLPLVEEGHRVLLRWTGFGPTSEADAFLSMNTASTLEEFDAAVDGLELGAFNFIYADAEGIAYRSSPLVPDRGAPGSFSPPWKIVPGDDPANVWTGATLPLNVLPRSRGGERGWVASANNDPYGFVGLEQSVQPPFYFGTFFAPGARAGRIDAELTRLVAEGSVSAADMRELQQDVHSPLAEPFLSRLQGALDARADDEALADFRERPDIDALAARLLAWDRDMDADSAEALEFHVFAASASRRIVADEAGFLYDALYEAAPIFALKLAVDALERGGDLVEGGEALVLLSALDDALQYVAATFPEGEYTWGDIHKLRFAAATAGLERPLLAQDGGDGTVNVADSPFSEDTSPEDPILTTTAAVYRMVSTFDADGRPRAEFQFLPGNGGDPAAEHWGDLEADWLNGTYRALPFDDEEIDAVLESTWTIPR